MSSFRQFWVREPRNSIKKRQNVLVYIVACVLPRLCYHRNDGNHTRYCGSCTLPLTPALSNIGIAIRRSKTVALPTKGHVPTPKQIVRLEGIGVSIAERGGVKVVGVPVGTDEYPRENTVEIVRNGGAEQLARRLSRMLGKQSANLIAPGSMVQWTSLP